MQRIWRKARNNWIEGKCKEVESLCKIQKVDAVHRKIRKNVQERRIHANIVKDINGKALTESSDNFSRWIEYIESLYKGNAVADLIENENKVQNDDRVSSVLKEEFQKELRGLKSNEAPGVQKKVWAHLCENYPNIILKTHTPKILVTIIYRRAKHTRGSFLNKDQFSSRKERGTREALLLLRLIQSGRPRVGKPTLIAFVNLEKAFDNVSWFKLLDILKNKEIKYKDRTIMNSLYRDQKAVVELQRERGEASMRKGVRQYCS